MIVVIQCASRKKPTAGHLRTRAGKPVMFVANPDAAPPDDRHAHACPDDASDTGRSWRSALLQYNEPRATTPWDCFRLGSSTAGRPTHFWPTTTA